MNLDRLVLKETRQGATKLVIENKNIKFNKAEIINYINRFNNLIKINLIDPITSFDDITWRCQYKHGKFRNINFSKNNLEINNIVKCLVILKLERGMKPYTLPPLINVLMQSLDITKNFSKDNLDDFKEFFIELPESTMRRARIIISDFFDFYPNENKDDYQYILNILPSYKSNTRKLPDYKSILIFDHAINKTIFNHDTEKDLLKYYPLFLWWKITSIIPLRPSEFLGLAVDCCWKDEKNRYWLKVPRQKNKENYANVSVEEVDILETTSDIYEFILKYKSLICREDQSFNLISWKTFNKFCINPKRNLLNKKDQDIMGLSSLSFIFNDFYKKIISNKNIIPLKPGDSRHLAFCNMLLQGFNPLAIARIGGHKDLESQLHYYNHLETYTESYIYTMAEKLKIENHLDIRNSSGKYDVLKRTGILSTYSSKEIEQFLKIEKGYCTVKSEECDDFSSCVNECCFCVFHILDINKYPEAQKEMHGKSGHLNDVIKEQIDLLKNISKNMLIDFSIEKSSFTASARIKSTSEQLQTYMSQKIVIDSKLLDYLGEDDLLEK